MSLKVDVVTFRSGFQSPALLWIEHYQKLLKAFVSVTVHWLKTNNAEDLTSQERLILNYLQRLKGVTWLADEHGPLWDNTQWKKQVRRWFETHPNRVIVIVGGPYGFSADFKKNFPNTFSLAPFTLNHQLALVVLLEALWRFISDYHRHPYHHGD